MRTNIEINEEIIQSALAISGLKTKKSGRESGFKGVFGKAGKTSNIENAGRVGLGRRFG